MNLPADKIVRQINLKNRDGFKYLFENYYPSLCHFSNRFLKDKQEAEDVVQDVFLRLWKSDVRFDSLKALTAFLYQSVRNASLNALRYRAKFTGDGMDGDQAAYLPEMEESSIERVIIEEEYVRQIHVAINKLLPERRKIILLSMKGLGNKEIAQSLGISVNTLKTLKKKAYRFLRDELEQLKSFLF